MGSRGPQPLPLRLSISRKLEWRVELDLEKPGILQGLSIAPNTKYLDVNNPKEALPHCVTCLHLVVKRISSGMFFPFTLLTRVSIWISNVLATVILTSNIDHICPLLQLTVFVYSTVITAARQS